MSRAFFVSALLVSALLAACGGGDGENGSSGDDAAPSIDAAGAGSWAEMPPLPVAVANNAVADLVVGTNCTIYSALGIGGALASADITSAAHRWRVGDAAWEAIDPVPGPARVAASAVAVAGNVYVFGGYTVAANGAEASSDRLDMFDTTSAGWVAQAAIPIPIDDTVALAWRDQFIVVVSGWSNTGNVDAVQIYDALADEWSSGTPFPGTAVFGHAGAIEGDTIFIVDGAASSAGFPLVGQTFRGELDPDNLGTIAWTDLGPHAGPKRYRAAGGLFSDGQLWIHGGTETPYNFDGLRYDNGQPAEPLASTLVLGALPSDLAPTDKPTATMDHRSLASCGDGAAFSVGGMTEGPQVTADVWSFDEAR